MPDTVTLTGIEIMAVGTWNGDEYGVDDLDSMVKAYQSGNAGIDPPLKLGHSEGQELVEGMPALGWVTNLRRNGQKLLADFKDVPKKIADLINNGAYKKVSSEVFFNLRQPKGARLPRVLSAVALLGAEIPAVSTLSDVEAWYGLDREGLEEAGYYKVSATLEHEACHVVEYKEGDGEEDLSDEEIRGKIQTFLSSLEGRLRGKRGISSVRFMMDTLARMPGTKPKEASRVTPELKKVLGLADDADDATVEAAVRELAAKKETPASTYASKDFTDLQDKVGQLTGELAKRDATTAVEDAIRARKLLPAQKEWAMGYAAKDPQGFQAYVEKTPAVDLAPKGGEGEGPADAIAPTSAEVKYASELGLSQEKLVAHKQATVAVTN